MEKKNFKKGPDGIRTRDLIFTSSNPAAIEMTLPPSHPPRISINKRLEQTTDYIY